MSEKTLVEVYGHHHLDFMCEAAETIGKSVPQNFHVMCFLNVLHLGMRQVALALRSAPKVRLLKIKTTNA
jgi:hypothetical protein